jgi:hypothetical protein
MFVVVSKRRQAIKKGKPTQPFETAVWGEFAIDLLIYIVYSSMPAT